MKTEEFIDGDLVRTRKLRLDPDVFNCLEELKSAGVEVKENPSLLGVYWVTGNAGQRFYLHNDEVSGRPKMHIPGEYHNNIADFRHLVLNVYHYQWRTQPVHADPVWRALFLRFEFAREDENGDLISVV